MCCAILYYLFVFSLLSLFVQSKKREHYPWRSVTEINTPAWVFFTFLDCSNGTKLCDASQIIFSVLGYDNLHTLSDHKKFFWRGFPYMISPLVPGLAQLTVNVFCVLVPQSKTEVCNSGTFRTCNSPYHLSSAICRVQVELQVQEQLS